MSKLVVMNGWRAPLGVVVAGLLAQTGCGDGPICKTEIFVAVTAPQQDATVSGLVDTDAGEPGIQLDVTAQTNLSDGDEATLVVTDSAGNVSPHTATVSATGDVTFEGVTMPGGEVTLTVTGESSAGCGSGTDTVAIVVTTETLCDIAINEGPITSDYYDPLPVLNTTNDSDPELPNFQANLTVSTVPGYRAEVFVLDVASGAEAPAASATAAQDGNAALAVTLGQGTQAIRATCVAADGGAAGASVVTTVYVDTESPGCELIDPAAGQAVIPEMDEDGATAGTQITLRGKATGDDVAGEAAAFTVGALELDDAEVGADGNATTTASFTAPGTVDVTFAAQDHAGNACVSDARAVSYVTEGCAIAHVAPIDVVTADGDDAAAGLQAALVVDVDAACAGRTVTTTCDITGAKTATVPAGGGNTSLPITVCESVACEADYDCETSVTSEDGITTSAAATLRADTLAPQVALQLTDPDGLTCDDMVTPGVDVDPGTVGVQIGVRALSPLAVSREIIITNGAAGSQRVPTGPGGDAIVTLEGGANNLVAVAADEFGNSRRTDGCALTLVDILVTFGPPVNDGLISASDGTVSDTGVTLEVSGTVSRPDVAVTLSVDGDPAQAAIVTGNDWRVPNVTLSEGDHTLVAEAVDGLVSETRTLDVRVDLGGPSVITDLAAFAPTRQSAKLTWTAPSDDGGAVTSYIVKMATVPLTGANFDTTGTTIVAPLPGTPGSTQSASADELRAGTDYHFAVASVDAVGNRSLIAAVGPVVPVFDASGAIAPPGAGNGDDKAAGQSMAAGDFNGDGFNDVAIAAPFTDTAAGIAAGAVHVYLGSAHGIDTAPAVTIEGDAAGIQLGNAVTALRWNDDDIDDLAIGAPFADGISGRVHVVLGGSQLDAGAASPIAVTDMATATIGADATDPGGFTGAGLGASLATADFDGDDQDDLVIGAPVVNAEGGAVVVFGGTSVTNIGLSTNRDTAGVRATLLPNPIAANDAGFFGIRVFNLGRTGGGSDDTDDVAIVYVNNAIDNDAVVVWRGRAAAVANGVDPLPWSAGIDLLIEADANSNGAYGEHVGSIGDVDGDGSRDIVVTEFGAADGRVFIVKGDAVGSQTIADVAITTITPETGVTQLGQTVLNNAAASAADIDADGFEDLVIAGGRGAGNVFLFVWFGGDIPAGDVTTLSAQHRIAGPTAFSAGHVKDGQRAPIAAIWAGDVTGDGLEDIAWADWRADEKDGAFEVLSDDE